jgi:hypothetical protein
MLRRWSSGLSSRSLSRLELLLDGNAMLVFVGKILACCLMRAIGSVTLIYLS